MEALQAQVIELPQATGSHPKGTGSVIRELYLLKGEVLVVVEIAQQLFRAKLLKMPVINNINQGLGVV